MPATSLPPLSALGPRIMISGPSNSGKSTLGLAIGRALGLEVVHLDQLRFLPGTDWQQRPDEDFRALHDAAITGDRWVVDGNYSMLAPQRIERATGIILLRTNRGASLCRYVRRTLFERDRKGSLAGNRDSIKWNMIHWILVGAPRSASRYREMLRASGRPLVELQSLGEINRAYRVWGLSRT